MEKSAWKLNRKFGFGDGSHEMGDFPTKFMKGLSGIASHGRKMHRARMWLAVWSFSLMVFVLATNIVPSLANGQSISSGKAFSSGQGVSIGLSPSNGGTSLKVSSAPYGDVKIAPGVYKVQGIDLNQLITDAEMSDKGKYSLDRVQKILERNQSILAKPLLVYRMTPSAHIYSTGMFVKPAKLIVDAQNQYRISARVILTMLQKEQSLLGSGAATVSPSSRRIIYATGYGALDSGDLLNMSGFDKQIQLSAKRLRTLIDEAPKKYPYPMSVNGGKVHRFGGLEFPGIVLARNASTYALYRYTPYTVDPALAPQISGGNFLFSQIYHGKLVQ